MTDIGSLGGDQIDVQGITNSGQIVGGARATVEGQEHAYEYTGIPRQGGSMAMIPGLTAGFSRAYGINNAGVLVGKSSPAFLYFGPPSTVKLVDLNTWFPAHNTTYPTWTLNVATSISTTGLVVGYADSIINGLNRTRAFVLEVKSLLCDLNGTINVDDYLIMDHARLRGLTGLTSGDFNDDGTIDGADCTQIDAAYSQQQRQSANALIAAHAAEFGAGCVDALAGLGIQIPEPASLSLLVSGAAMLTLSKRTREHR